jgi:hypothetical protein
MKASSPGLTTSWCSIGSFGFEFKITSNNPLVCSQLSLNRLRQELENSVAHLLSKLDMHHEAKNLISDNLYIYIKDPKGIYIGCNDKLANDIGFNSGINIIDQSDHDLTWSQEAQQLILNDQQVLQHHQELLVNEHCAMPDGNINTFLSQKKPLTFAGDAFNSLIGISINTKNIISS